MRRRDFIALGGGAALAWPRAVEAQQSGDISASFFFREQSFSLIYFAGMTRDAMPELLVRCGYSSAAARRDPASCRRDTG
jgi:hypothetical protein